MDAASKRPARWKDSSPCLTRWRKNRTKRPNCQMWPNFPAAKCWPWKRKSAGVYITGGPLDEYRAQLDALKQLPLRAPGVQRGSRPSIRSTACDHGRHGFGSKDQGHQNQIMAFVQLEDLYGATEVLVFPRVYERYRSVLLGDSVVLLNGRLSVREDEAPKLILESARALGQGGSETPAAEAYLSPAREAPRPVPEKRPARMLYLKLDRAASTARFPARAHARPPRNAAPGGRNRTLRAPQNYSVRAVQSRRAGRIARRGKCGDEIAARAARIGRHTQPTVSACFGNQIWRHYESDTPRFISSFPVTMRKKCCPKPRAGFPN